MPFPKWWLRGLCLGLLASFRGHALQRGAAPPRKATLLGVALGGAGSGARTTPLDEVLRAASTRPLTLPVGATAPAVPKPEAREEAEVAPERAHALEHRVCVDVANPAYVHAFNDELWLTQFGLRRGGNVVRVPGANEVASFQSGADERRQRPLMWPNALTHVPGGTFDWAPTDGVLVCDGFLAPGAGDGGVYFLSGLGKAPGRDEAPEAEAGRILLQRLTPQRKGWFYHKAVLLDLRGDGSYSVLCARGRKPLFGAGAGELVLLEMPPGWAARGEYAGPWRETVLATGPDVMFDVIDENPGDGELEVYAAEFFSKRLSKHVLGTDASGRATLRRSEVLDDTCGPAYGVYLARLKDAPRSPAPSPFGCIGADLDRGATHILMTSHESIYADSLADAAFPPRRWFGRLRLHADAARKVAVQAGNSLRRLGLRARVKGTGCKAHGGSLFSYPLAAGPGRIGEEARRTVLASGFRVRGVSINPGAPGFVYAFYPRRRDDPAASGDRPETHSRPHLLLAGDCAQAAYVLEPRPGGGPESYDVLEVLEIDGTVGSLAVCYGDTIEMALGAFPGARVSSAPGSRRDQEDDDWARILVPNYDGDEVHVFKMALR